MECQGDTGCPEGRGRVEEGKRSLMEPEGWRDEAKSEEWNPIVEAGQRLTKVEPEG